MVGRIYLLNDNGELMPMEEAPYDSETQSLRNCASRSRLTQPSPPPVASTLKISPSRSSTRTFGYTENSIPIRWMQPCGSFARALIRSGPGLRCS